MTDHTTQSQMRFGVLGTGRITRRIVADIQSTDGASVTAIASRTAERAKWYADEYGVACGVEGYENLISREDVDAVYIALPPSMHAKWSIESAEQGRHVLCEKPLATSLEELMAVRNACEKANVRWLDATSWLHHERTEAFARWIKGDALGKIGHISASLSFYKPFQSDEHRLDASLGGGCILDLGWYVGGLVQFALRCCGASSMPHRVESDVIITNDVPLRLNAILRFENQITASLSCGYDTSTRKWFEVAGSTASLICDDFTRPWPDRPARCWIHDAAGKAEQHQFEGNQERRMIAKFISDAPLDDLQDQAIATQSLLDQIRRNNRMCQERDSI